MKSAASARDSHDGQSSSSFQAASTSLETGPSVRHREMNTPGPTGVSMVVIGRPPYGPCGPRHR